MLNVLAIHVTETEVQIEDEEAEDVSIDPTVRFSCCMSTSAKRSLNDLGLRFHENEILPQLRSEPVSFALASMWAL